MAARGTDGLIRPLMAAVADRLRRAAGLLRRVLGGRRAPLLLGVVCVLATAACGWFGLRVWQANEDRQRDRDVLAAARQSAVNFTSLDYRRYDKDSKNVLRGATGDFKKQFAAQTRKLTKLVAENKSVSKGQVLEAGIVRADDKSARVLVVADSSVTNVASPDGQSRNYRLQLDLVNEGGRWLTSGVEFVG